MRINYDYVYKYQVKVYYQFNVNYHDKVSLYEYIHNDV